MGDYNENEKVNSEVENKTEEVKINNTNVKKGDSMALAICSLVCSLIGLLIAGIAFGVAAIYLGISAFKSKLEANYLKILAGIGIGLGAFDIIAVMIQIALKAAR